MRGVGIGGTRGATGLARSGRRRRMQNIANLKRRRKNVSECKPRRCRNQEEEGGRERARLVERLVNVRVGRVREAGGSHGRPRHGERGAATSTNGESGSRPWILEGLRLHCNPCTDVFPHSHALEASFPSKNTHAPHLDGGGSEKISTQEKFFTFVECRPILHNLCV